MAEGYLALPLNVTAGNVSSAAMATAWKFDPFTLRTFWYLVTPNETTYQDISEVPNYFLKGISYIPLLMVTELILLLIQGRKLPTYGDAMCSLCCGLLLFLPVAVIGQFEISLYIWCYEKFHIVDLPWDSLIVWFSCVLFVDFAFYFWHRAGHEVNFLWAVHQVHHTSQEFNITVGLRLPTLNRLVVMLFYMPLAFFFPPSIFYAHYQLNYIFQFWLHTDCFPQIPFLEYFIITPSLHRVHHGRNRYCIDKNYGAVFSFWDLLFGTYEKERLDEQIHYGLVHNVKSFDVMYLQIHHLKAMFNNLIHYRGVGNKLSAVFKGPGWEPGKPRLGNIEEIPEVPEDTELHDVSLPMWIKVYLFLHYTITFLQFFRIKITKELLSPGLAWLHAGYILWALASQGMFLDRRPSALLWESVRCAAYFALEVVLQGQLASDPYSLYALRTIMFVSFLLCAANVNLFRKEDQPLKMKQN